MNAPTDRILHILSALTFLKTPIQRCNSIKRPCVAIQLAAVIDRRLYFAPEYRAFITPTQFYSLLRRSDLHLYWIVLYSTGDEREAMH